VLIGQSTENFSQRTVQSLTIAEETEFGDADDQQMTSSRNQQDSPAETQRHGGGTRPETAGGPEIAEGTPGLTGAKSIFSGVEQGVG
jgi:hypothetical protein